MSSGRIGALARRIVLQFRRDHRTLGLLVIVPVVVLGLVGYLLRSPTSPPVIALVNQDVAVTTPVGTFSLGQQLADALKQSTDIQAVETNEADADARVRDGSAQAAVVIGSDFTAKVAGRSGARLRVVLEGSNPSTTGETMQRLTKAIRGFTPLVPGPGSATPAFEPPSIDTTYIYGGEQFDVLDYFAPVFIALFATFFVFIYSSVSFLRERSQGTLERLMASPITRTEVILGYMVGFGVFALLQLVVILTFTVYVLQVHTVGNLLIVFLVGAMLTVGAVNMGLFFSAFARNELQVMQFVPLVIVPQALLSGVFWPVKGMPDVLQWLAHVMPLTYANEALRDVMIKGHGLTDSNVALDLLVLLFYAAAMVVAGALTLRREIA